MKYKTEKLNKIQTLIWIIFNFLPFKIIRIVYSRVMMTLAVLFFPRFTYLFSFNNKLPLPKNKINSTKDPLKDWIFKDGEKFKDYNKKKINEEVLVFFKRESPEFKKYQYKKIKKYLVNWESNCEGKNIFYTTADNSALSHYINQKQFPCFYVNPFYYDEKKNPYYIKNINKVATFKCPSGINYSIKLNPNDLKILQKNKKSEYIFMNHQINYN